jgi:predicted PurR-regulated permease PerM
MPRRPPVVSPIREAAVIQRRRVDELWRSRDFRALIFLGVLATLTLLLAIAIRGILGPFIVAGILALMLNPVVNAAERRRVPRVVAVLVLYAVLGAALAAGILFLVPLIRQEFVSLVAQGPAIASYFQDMAVREHVVSVLGIPIDLRQAYNDSVHNLPALLAGHLSSVVENVFMLLNWIFETLLVLLVAFFLIKDAHAIRLAE